MTIERLGSDEEFAGKVCEAIAVKREHGATNYYETFIPVANEMGYEISKEELDKIHEMQISNLSEEELGKVSGGTSCMYAVISLSAASVIAFTAVGVVDAIERLTE